MALKRDIKSLKVTINRSVTFGTFSTEDLKRQAIILSEQLTDNETAVTAELKQEKEKDSQSLKEKFLKN